MARDGWFDGKGLDLYRNDFLDTHPGWQRYIADRKITAGELLEQELKIATMLKEMEPHLPDEAHEKVTRVLLEYEVLVNMALIHYPTVMERPEFWTLASRHH
ncbi:MAG: hypothetical protein FJX76_11295 [Armatimonadetes bacterium]|nr:hypothetical protein [Armatimonadota bacterium]